MTHRYVLLVQAGRDAAREAARHYGTVRSCSYVPGTLAGTTTVHVESEDPLAERLDGWVNDPAARHRLLWWEETHG